MNGDLLYRDPQWQQTRLRVMSRDNWRCAACRNGLATLHIHHMKYIGDVPWDTPDEWLQTLCETCHSALGPHPHGGVWWEWDDDLDAAIFVCDCCPVCGGRESKDKGSYAKCMSCGHRLLPVGDKICAVSMSF
jgi:hypothetical protein